MLGAIADYKNEAKERILQALGKVDVMITTGGVSVGDHDIMTDIFLDWDGEQLFNKIRMRPGSVSSAGVWREKVLFALSGNPSACFVGFELFAAPMIRGMQGASEPFPVEQTAFMREDFLKANAFQRFVRGRMEIENGTIQVMPVGIDQSSVTTSIAAANCLIVIPPTNKGVEKGELVSIIPLNQGGGR